MTSGIHALYVARERIVYVVNIPLNPVEIAFSVFIQSSGYNLVVYLCYVRTTWGLYLNLAFCKQFDGRIRVGPTYLWLELPTTISANVPWFAQIKLL